MNFSIIIPTFNNIEYLKLTIKSILKNSKYNHQIIVHINGIDNKTKNYLRQRKIAYTESSANIGLCSGVNCASKKSIYKYICYSHDDMYFLPEWDLEIKNEIQKINSKFFYFSSTQISPQKKTNDINNHIFFNAGKDVYNFDEKKILQNYKKLKFYDLKGSHWAPHVIHIDVWKKIGGFSEEFNPGFVSDPDLNMKLWTMGVRIFKGINKSRVYHFGSLTTRKRNVIIRNNGKKTFLLKWGITVEHFINFYLHRGEEYNGPSFITKNFYYFLSLTKSKLKYLFYYLSNV